MGLRYKLLMYKINKPQIYIAQGFPGGASGKEPTCHCRRHKKPVSYPWVGKTPWRRHDNPLHYSCLENFMDRRPCWATVHGVTKSWTWLKWLSTHLYLLYSTGEYRASLVVQLVKNLPEMKETWVQKIPGLGRSLG